MIKQKSAIKAAKRLPSTNSAIIVTLAALLWVAALLIASRYDLSISLAIADPMSFFGRLLEIAGEPPAILFTAFNFSLIIAALLKKPHRERRDLIFAGLSAVGMFGAAYYTINQTFVYLAEWKETFAIPSLMVPALLAAAVGLIFLACAMKLDYSRLEKCFHLARHCVFAAITTLLIIWCFKLLWGRVRFRQLDGDLSRFTPWYRPQGYTGYYSFPSGHTANAAVVLTAAYYMRFLPDSKRWLKPVIDGLLAVWIVLLAYSRVRVGAHYLSDVLCGAAFTLAIVYFWRPKKTNARNNTD